MVLAEEVDLRLTGVGRGMVPVCWEVGLICIDVDSFKTLSSFCAESCNGVLN